MARQPERCQLPANLLKLGGAVLERVDVPEIFAHGPDWLRGGQGVVEGDELLGGGDGGADGLFGEDVLTGQEGLADDGRLGGDREGDDHAGDVGAGEEGGEGGGGGVVVDGEGGGGFSGRGEVAGGVLGARVHGFECEGGVGFDGGEVGWC